MFNSKILILTLAIIAYFVARVIMSDASTPQNMRIISEDEKNVKFNTLIKE